MLLGLQDHRSGARAQPRSSTQPASAVGSQLARAVVDVGVRTAYRGAHRVLRTWWMIRRPHTRGALVAVWNAGEILLVKNSYRAQYTLPGGYIRTGESPIEAAARELAEEVNIHAESTDFREVYNGIHPFEHRRDEVTIVEIDLDDRPTVAVDNREVVWAGFASPYRALALCTVPHAQEYLQLVINRR